MAAGLTSFGKTAVSAASDLEEWKNVVEVAFGSAKSQVDTFAKQALSQFGLSAVASRKLAGTFMAMADGIGLSNEAGAKMSIQLAGLSADMASFFNSNIETTSNALEGVFTNQTRALKQFGIVMSDANLEAFRMAQGITTAYNQMSEAQRVALRYNYVLAATTNAQNDFARTSMNWANQMRQLAMNWSQLTSTVGSMLIKLLTPVVAILNKILTAAIAVVNAIAKIFGGQGIKGVTEEADGIGDMASGIEDMGDGLNNANKAAKKYKATIAGFDELEVLNPQPTSGSGGGAGNGLGGAGTGAEDIGAYFDLYDEEGVLNKFEDFFQKIKDMMDADNWEGVGAEVGKGLNKVFQVIDDFITNKFEPFGVLWSGRIARILNGLVNETDWDLIGKTFADGLNALIRIANEFYEKFDALNFAIGIATAINSWFRNVDWEGIGQYLANKLNFLGDLLYGFATTIDWEQIKNSVQTALTNLFNNLDVEKIKTAIAQLVEDAMEFLKSVDWYQIGYTVGEMLSGVDWLGVFKSVKDEVIWPAFKGFWNGLMSDGQNFLLGIIGKVKSWFEESFWGPFAAAAFGAVGTNIMLGAIRGFFKDGSNNFLGEMARSVLYVVGQIPIIGKPFKKAWKTLTDMMQVKGEFKLTFFESIQVYLDSLSGGPLIKLRAFITAIKNFVLSWKGASIITGIIIALSSAYGGLGGALDRVKQVFTDAWDIVKKVMDALGASEAIDYIKDAFGRLGDAVKKVYDALANLKPMWELIFGIISTAIGVIGGLVGYILTAVGTVVGLIVDAVAGIINAVEPVITWLTEVVGGVCQAIIDFFAWLKYQLIGDPIIIDMWEGIKQVFKDAIDAVIGFVKGLVDSVVEFFTNLWNKAVEIFTNIKNFLTTTWNNIKTFATNTWTSIKTFFSDTWNAIKTKTAEIWNGIKSFLTGIWTGIKNAAGAAWDWMSQKISGIWTAISTFTSTAWSNIKTTLWNAWEGIKTTVSNAIGSVSSTISNIWTSIKTTTSSIWTSISSTIGGFWDGLKTKADNITSAISGAFSGAWTSITNAWSGFSGWFSGIFNGLGGVVRSGLNGVIGAMNSLSFKVPDWVPWYGGDYFGFNIPYLAQGGVIDSPTVAMMGEYSGAGSNPEIVAPQSMLRDIVREENGEMVSALYQIANQIITAIGDVDLNVSIGDDTIGNAANRANNAYKKRTGKPLFSM